MFVFIFILFLQLILPDIQDNTIIKGLLMVNEAQGGRRCNLLIKKFMDVPKYWNSCAFRLTT